MVAVPRVSYAKTDDGAHIAYQVVGDGPLDLVFIPWWWNHLETQWDDPLISHFLERLARFARLILFDMRGVGLSDPVGLNDLPTLERWMADAKAVLDAVGSSHAMVLGHGDGGLVAMLFAATYPERTSGLILVDAYALLAADEGYEGWEPSLLDSLLATFADVWGTGDPGWVTVVAPSKAADEAFCERLARLERGSVSPGAAAAIQLVIGHLDVRPVLTAISAPTLVVVHREQLLHAGDVRALPLRTHTASEARRARRRRSLVLGRKCRRNVGRDRAFRDRHALPAPHRTCPRALCSSPTSPVPPVVPPNSGICAGASCSRLTTPWCVASWSASRAEK